MTHQSRWIQSGIIFLLLPALTVFGQAPGSGRYQRGRPRTPQAGNDIGENAGTFRGTILRIQVYDRTGDKGSGQNRTEARGGKRPEQPPDPQGMPPLSDPTAGTISVRTEHARQFTGTLLGETEYIAEGANLPRSAIIRLLRPGVPVELNWKSAEGVGGGTVAAVRIRTVPIEGSIVSISGKKVVVLATPKQALEPPPDIRVQGRPPMLKDNKKSAPPKPRKLALALSKDTYVTLDGKETPIRELRPKMEMNAVVMDGGPRIVLELSARSQESTDQSKPPDEHKKSG